MASPAILLEAPVSPSTAMFETMLAKIMGTTTAFNARMKSPPGNWISLTAGSGAPSCWHRRPTTTPHAQPRTVRVVSHRITKGGFDASPSSRRGPSAVLGGPRATCLAMVPLEVAD
mmetsp:Transcript_21034/g.57472  ORF Transcript_21034/g.57472 Transcript_21034/m.57472 type:complete len:116 (+) Transcript_21034:474-821(+)